MIIKNVIRHVGTLSIRIPGLAVGQDGIARGFLTRQLGKFIGCISHPRVPSFLHSLPSIVIAIANQKCTNLINLRSTARHRNAVTPIFPVPLLVCKTAKIHMPHSRFQRTLDNGHIHQKMQRPIPAPRQAIVCVGFLT